ncbi:MAG TPA: zeta toxin family protein [Hanamia sp.]
MRIFAGPNGSGKTTLINELRTVVPFGIYLNADDIEKSINELGYFNLSEYKIYLQTSDIQLFFKYSDFSPKKLNNENLWKHLIISDSKIMLTDGLKINSYLAADIANFLRESLLEKDISFSYETVMSHTSKLDFIKKASTKGFRIYLYFIATEDPEININRVKIRVAQKGHPVNSEVIRSRYYRSLENLKAAISLSNRAYIFDNSGKIIKLISEVSEDKQINRIDKESLPDWFMQYLNE